MPAAAPGVARRHRMNVPAARAPRRPNGPARRGIRRPSRTEAGSRVAGWPRPGDFPGRSISRPSAPRARRSGRADRRSASPGRGARPAATGPSRAARSLSPRSRPLRRRPSRRGRGCTRRLRQSVLLRARFLTLRGRPLRIPLSSSHGVPESVPRRRPRDTRRLVSVRARRCRCRTVARRTAARAPRLRRGARPSSSDAGEVPRAFGSNLLCHCPLPGARSRSDRRSRNCRSPSLLEGILSLDPLPRGRQETESCRLGVWCCRCVLRAIL